VIVHNLDFMRAILTPDEDDAPLAVDPDRMLASPVASQCLQAVAGGKTQIIQPLGSVDCGEFPPGRYGQIPRHAAGLVARKDARAVVLSPKLRITTVRSA
jgi:hypothetical protein